jgi:hypothetical protein
MLNASLLRSKGLAVGLIFALVLLIMPLMGFEDPQTTYSKQGTLQGTVFSEGGRAPVANAIVKIRNLNNQKEYTSQPTDAKGGYKILMIEEGWYTLGVTTAAGDFSLNYGVYIKAGETAKLSVEMQPGGMLAGKGGNSGSKKGFFSTPGGILVIVALAGAAGFGVYELTKNEAEVSPIR